MIATRQYDVRALTRRMLEQSRGNGTAVSAGGAARRVVVETRLTRDELNNAYAKALAMLNSKK
ncbi:hypothetical protein JJQ59_28400 [Cupriavidus necator]|uniref:hypothetical protein n=1 Tax=Cupriavidus necator TaxID=106590 RepID=UPI0011BD46E9|nr:hypothetical protein [Cupriavidus necator]QQX86683.1 hypothetical protein JJQ59_28400 [Cupriavidus necator]